MKIRVVNRILCFALVLTACGIEPVPIHTSLSTLTPSTTTTIPSSLEPPFQPVVEPARYRRNPLPIISRVDSDQTSFLEDKLGLRTGKYTLEYRAGRFVIYPKNGEVALALTLPGGNALNVLGDNPTIETRTSELVKQIILSGKSEWGSAYVATLWVFPFHPGLIRWRLEIILDEIPSGSPELELQFVNRSTGEEVGGALEIYADRAPMAAPHLYAYSAALDSTLFYWVDLTALNPFMDAAHYTPVATPRRRAQRLGHNFSTTDLRSLPEGVPIPLYDSYLYLTPGEPLDEDAMFTRYLHNLGDIYDLMAVPEDPLFDWFLSYSPSNDDDIGDATRLTLQEKTIRDLANETNWVTIEGHRYLRAYVSDTRQTAEAITQLDVFTALARYKNRFGIAPDYYQVLRRTIPEFFNPDLGPQGMFQNTGPLSLTGSQSHGDTWYELGHALKVAELALWDPEDIELRELALRSGETWIDFAHRVDYRFPRFYSFVEWDGTGVEPDAGGGFAYFMLLLHDLTGEERFLDEARTAVHALGGYGFRLSYETHMTALAAAAAARLYQLEPDEFYLRTINRAVANLMRLAWLWECDYGWMGSNQDGVGLEVTGGITPPRTFFGLNPTQQSAAITPKEQYEAWVYLIETLQRVHNELDPTVEKLIAEFLKHTLLTIPWSVPPFLPEGAATEHPAAYETVSSNDLSLYIPLEDLRDGWTLSGVIGQEIYGAGMAPTMAALALSEIIPGVTVYSGYPLVDIDGLRITFTGVSGNYTHVVVVGIQYVHDVRGDAITIKNCGSSICFQAEGGATYQLIQ